MVVDVVIFFKTRRDVTQTNEPRKTTKNLVCDYKDILMFRDEDMKSVALSHIDDPKRAYLVQSTWERCHIERYHHVSIRTKVTSL